MSDEENIAIETLKEVASDNFDTLGDDISPKMAQNILNLIENQQKEIEEKNITINKMSKDISRQLEEIEEKSTIIMVGAEKVKQLEKEIEELKHNRDEYKEEYIKLLNARYYNYISKDKIREKIKEYETAINQNKLMSIRVRQHGFARENIIQNIIRGKIETLEKLLEEE